MTFKSAFCRYIFFICIDGKCITFAPQYLEASAENSSETIRQKIIQLTMRSEKVLFSYYPKMAPIFL